MASGLFDGFDISGIVVSSQPTHVVVESNAECITVSAPQTVIQTIKNDFPEQVKIETSVHSPIQGIAALFMDLVDHVHQLAFAVSMDIPSTRSFNIKSVTDSLHVFEETVTRYMVDQVLVKHFNDAYKTYFNNCVDYIINGNTKTPGEVERLLSELKTNDYPYDWLVKIYMKTGGDQKDKFATDVMYQWRKFSHSFVCLLEKILKTSYPQNYHKMHAETDKLAEQFAESMYKIFSKIPYGNRDYREYAASNENTEVSLYGIYSSMMEYVSNKDIETTQISSAIQGVTSEEINNIVKSGKTFCSSVGIEDCTEIRTLILSFINFCENVKSAGKAAEIDHVLSKHLEHSESLIGAIAGKAPSKGPPKNQPKQKNDSLAVVWQDVHKKVAKMVAKAKKNFATKKKDVYTYFKKKNMKTHFELIESSFKQTEVQSPKQSHKKTSWLDKQVETNHGEKAAKHLGTSLAKLSKVELTEDTFDHFLSEATMLTKNGMNASEPLKFFDQEKISSVPSEQLHKLQRDVYAIHGIAQDIQTKTAFIKAWYDFLRGGDLASLIVKFCESFDSTAELEGVVVWAKSIAGNVLQKWRNKSILSTERVNALVVIAMAHVFKAKNSSDSVTNDLYKIRREYEGGSGAAKGRRKGIEAKHHSELKIAGTFSTNDVDNLANRTYDFIEDVAKKGMENMSSNSTIAADQLAGEVHKKLQGSKGDKPTLYRNMGRFGIGILLQIEESPSVPDAVKGVIRRKILST
jgi:hypothetical protein